MSDKADLCPAPPDPANYYSGGNYLLIERAPGFSHLSPRAVGSPRPEVVSGLYVVGWNDLQLFCDLRKWTHCCLSGIYFYVFNSNKIGKSATRKRVAKFLFSTNHRYSILKYVEYVFRKFANIPNTLLEQEQ